MSKSSPVKRNRFPGGRLPQRIRPAPRRNYLKDLTPFSLKQILRKLNSINVQINLEHRKIFPKERYRFLSLYQYKKRFVGISPQGYFSFSNLATSLIDFSFVRSEVSSSYSREGGVCFDPASIFVLLPLVLKMIFLPV